MADFNQPSFSSELLRAGRDIYGMATGAGKKVKGLADPAKSDWLHEAITPPIKKALAPAEVVTPGPTYDNPINDAFNYFKDMFGDEEKAAEAVRKIETIPGTPIKAAAKKAKVAAKASPLAKAVAAGGPQGISPFAFQPVAPLIGQTAGAVEQPKGKGGLFDFMDTAAGKRAMIVSGLRMIERSSNSDNLGDIISKSALEGISTYDAEIASETKKNLDAEKRSQEIAKLNAEHQMAQQRLQLGARGEELRQFQIETAGKTAGLDRASREKIAMEKLEAKTGMSVSRSLSDPVKLVMTSAKDMAGRRPVTSEHIQAALMEVNRVRAQLGEAPITSKDMRGAQSSPKVIPSAAVTTDDDGNQIVRLKGGKTVPLEQLLNENYVVK